MLAKRTKPQSVDLLEWDSAFFGFPVAQISGPRVGREEMIEIISWCKQVSVRLLQFKCDAHSHSSIIASEENGFHFVDARLTFSRGLKGPLPVVDENGFSGRMAKPEDVVALHAFVDGIFTQSRYFFDRNFDREKVHAFYCDWVLKAIDGDFDDWVYCQCDNNKPVAFCTLREHSHESPRIGLIGVNPSVRGRSVAQAMLADVLRILRDRGHEQIHVVTQGRNYSAQRLYQRAGFLTEKLEIYYHKWFDEEAT